MSNKRVNLTLVNLDITQLSKIRQYTSGISTDKTSVHGAYGYELRELLDAIISAGYANKTVLVAPELTI
jgi:hypothetical protein